jgi:alpha-beta hydrolase superfamily lysophospholipase
MSPKTQTTPKTFRGGNDRLFRDQIDHTFRGSSVEDAHDALKERSDVIIVGGLSAGVLLALHLAAERPREVHGTLLSSPTFWPHGWAIPRYSSLFKLVRY